MNISLENRVIWLATERSGEEILSNFFEKYSFYKCEIRNNFKLVKLSNTLCSRAYFIPDEYKNYPVFATVRNPYDRLWSCYLNFFTKRVKTNDLAEVKKRFNEFLSDVFKKTLDGIKVDPFFESPSYISKWKFTPTYPNVFIRYEFIKDDLNKLDFLDKSDIQNIPKFETHILYEQDYKINFNQVYEIENAQNVYEYFKNEFFIFGYDPFSFCTDILTTDLKMKFVHGYLLSEKSI